MSDHADVLILGGGVIGLTTAYFLAGERVSVTLLDRGDFGQQTSWAGAGILSPGPRPATTPLDQLHALSSRLYPTLSQQLREETHIDNGYLVCGGLELLGRVGAEEAEPTTEWRTEGCAFEKLDRSGLLRREPGLTATVETGYYLPDMAQVRNPRHLRALEVACVQRGVRLVPHCPALRLLRHGSHIDAIETAQGRMSAGRYLVAAGAWSDSLLTQAGWQPGVRPVRGQIALLNTAAAGGRPLLLHGKRYLVPRPDGRLLVGATEEEAGFDARPSAAGIAGLLAFAAALVPALADAPLERCWAGLRPGTPDGLPFLGAVPGCTNLYVAAGHFRSGIQLSPGTGVVLKELLLDQPLSVPLEAFRLDRGSTAPAQTAFRS